MNLVKLTLEELQELERKVSERIITIQEAEKNVAREEMEALVKKWAEKGYSFNVKTSGSVYVHKKC